MKKKNGGFTLSELLGVIVVLTLIITIASSSVINIMNRGRSKLREEIRSNLKEAALSYSLDKVYLKKCETDFEPSNIRSVDNGCFALVTVEELLKDGSFEDSHGFCDKAAQVVVYRFNDGVNSEYKAFVSDDSCNN